MERRMRVKQTTIGWYNSEGFEPDSMGLFTFEHDESLEDVETAIRDAIFAFLDTEEGREIAESNNDFNWGDAATSMGDEDWAKFGLKLLHPTAKADIIVHHDENFFGGNEDDEDAED